MGANISIFFYILSIRKVVCIINASGSKFCAFLLSGVYSVFHGRLRALSWFFNWYELFFHLKFSTRLRPSPMKKGLPKTCQL